MARSSKPSEKGQRDAVSDAASDSDGANVLTPITLKMLALADGSCPFEEWYNGIRDNSTRARIRARLVTVRRGTLGVKRGVGTVAELKLDFGPGYRIYYIQQGNTIVILLGGGDKSSQPNDIKRARQRWKENKDDSERFQRDFPE